MPATDPRGARPRRSGPVRPADRAVPARLPEDRHRVRARRPPRRVEPGRHRGGREPRRGLRPTDGRRGRRGRRDPRAARRARRGSRNRAISDLGQAVADRDQQSSDLEQDRTDRIRDELGSDPDDGRGGRTLDGSAIRAAQERRDAHQELLDDAQDARDREQSTFDDQQDELDARADAGVIATAERRFRTAEIRAAAAEERALAALQRARLARERAAAIARLDAAPD